MRIGLSRRTAGVVLGVVALLSTTAELTGCSAPQPPPTICQPLAWSVNLHDSTGAGDDHLRVFANVCVDPAGDVTSSTGSAVSSTYGFLNFFGNIVTAQPLWAAGNVGQTRSPVIRGWINTTQYTFTMVLDVHLSATIGGLGFAGDQGLCVATWPLWITSGGNQVASGAFPNLSRMRASCHDGYFLSYAT